MQEELKEMKSKMNCLYRINLSKLSSEEKQKISIKTQIPYNIIPLYCRLFISQNNYFLIWLEDDIEGYTDPGHASIFICSKNYQSCQVNYKIIPEWKPKLINFLQILILSFEQWQRKGMIQKIKISKYLTHPNKDLRELLCKHI